MNRKMATMFTTLIIALSMVGVAYTLWSEDLFISGVVNTGSIGAAFEEVRGYDNEPDGKDFSDIHCEVQGNTLLVTVTNAYPCITYTNEFYIHNTGTIPIHIYPGVVVDTSSPYPLEMSWVKVVIPKDPLVEYFQLHPCFSVLCSIVIHLDNTAEQGATYSFTVDLPYCQWNEPLV